MLTVWARPEDYSGCVAQKCLGAASDGADAVELRSTGGREESLRLAEGCGEGVCEVAERVGSA